MGHILHIRTVYEMLIFIVFIVFFFFQIVFLFFATYFPLFQLCYLWISPKGECQYRNIWSCLMEMFTCSSNYSELHENRIVWHPFCHVWLFSSCVTEYYSDYTWVGSPSLRPSMTISIRGLSDRISNVSSMCLGDVHTSTWNCPLAIGSLGTQVDTRSEQGLGVDGKNESVCVHVCVRRFIHVSYRAMFSCTAAAPPLYVRMYWSSHYCQCSLVRR